MSKGPGIIERRIADLLAATRDRALSVEDIAAHAFRLRSREPTRTQRLSATRAAHRLLKRTRETEERARKLINQAHARVESTVGIDARSEAYQARLAADRDFIEGCKLHDHAGRIGRRIRLDRDGAKPGFIKIEGDTWMAETVNRRLYLRPPDVPLRVWAVSLGPGGITWAEAAVLKVTKRNVMVRYANETARLDRRSLWRWWAFWRGVQFVSSRTGRIATKLDEIWWQRFGARGSVPPSLRMPLADAMALLGVPADYTPDDVIAAFRRAAMRAHPDQGGTAEDFRKAVEARDRLLDALGTSAPPPKPPSYAPKGASIVYRTARTSAPRLGASGPRRLA